MASTEQTTRGGLALVLGGGAARGLAHIGVLEVLEADGIRVEFLAGSSMGGLIAALRAVGLGAREIAEVARGFRFPRWFVPGSVPRWARIFPTAERLLQAKEFRELEVPLAVTAVDVESGLQAVLHDGPLLPAVQATCAVPGVLEPVRLGGRWLFDGGVVNVVPVDVAWMSEPDVVVAVKVQASRGRHVPHLGRPSARLASWLGAVVPNPASARVGFEVLVRAAEIALDHQATLAAAMAGPEVVIDADVGDVGLRDFHRLDEAVEAGRRAARAALPELRRVLESGARPGSRPRHTLTLHFDPVCNMVVSPRRARAKLSHEGTVYYFCSLNCLETFDRARRRADVARRESLSAPHVR